MKKVIITMIVVLFSLTLTACTNDETPGLSKDGDGFENQVPTVVDVLETAGYVLTEHDADAISYFQQNTIDDLGVTATVTALYIGYQDGNNWVQVIGFNTTEGASAVATAFENEQDEGQLVYLNENTVVLTYTQVTYDLFD